MQSSAATVDGYLASLPAERRDAIAQLRDVINRALPPGFEEKMQYGMISWCVPESALPAREVYNKQPLCLASLASQKNHMAVYLLSVYGDPKERTWFEAAFKRSGKKLDMGQSCVRFKSLDALPLDVIGEAMSHVTVDRYVAAYKRIRAATKTASSRTSTAASSSGKGKQLRAAKSARATSAKAKAAKAKPAKARRGRR